ncbi:MAG: metallophosphoesterase family protein [Ruminococcus sp.]|nr:metallophosphoesterase family protein [Ruminococcus sp.]
MAKFYIADLHLGHENVIKHDCRPFKNKDEMRETIIRNWNNAVSPADEVYILGDFAWKNGEGLETLSQLRGTKYLILGNHDSPSEEMKYYFKWIKDMAVIKDGGRTVVLCHYPIAHWYGQFRGAVHLYGHVHNNKDYGAFLEYARICRDRGIPFDCCNVGCMMEYMGYTPRRLEELSV